jgi:rhodanese-related sulfurtransferase
MEDEFSGSARRQRGKQGIGIAIALLFYNVGLDFNHIYHWNHVKFIIDNILLIGMAVFSAAALAWPLVQRRGAKLSLLQATQLINQGKSVVVDVRVVGEYAAGHIASARNIPAKELVSRLGELDKFKARPVIVVCGTGVDSAKASSHLKRAGFTDVYSLNGGLAAWRAQGMPTTK